MTKLEEIAMAIYDAPTSFDGDPVGVHLGRSEFIDAATETAEQERAMVMSICMDAARAAVEAMRVATEAMKQAGCNKYPGRDQFPDSMGEAFTAMIDTILSEHDGRQG